MALPWYSQVPKEKNLEQGDFVANLEVPIPEYSYEEYKKRKKIKPSINWKKADWIVMTQSCDLDPENNRDMQTILLCPVFTLSEFVKDNPLYSNKDKMQSVLEGKKIGIHPLKSPLKSWRYYSEHLLINFRDAVPVSLEIVQQHKNAARRAQRLRLNPPYAEAMAQRFGIIYSRIAYPVGFPTKEDVQAFRNS